MQRLKERLVNRRNALNLSQVALAEKSGVSERAIAGYETGEAHPTHSRLEKLAQALGVSPAWLLGGPEMPPGIHDTDTPPPDGQPMLQSMPQKVLVDLFGSLGEELKQAREPERSRIVDLVNAVHEELLRRESSEANAEGEGHEVILHQKKKPGASSAAASAAGKKVKPFADAHLAKLRARAASGESSRRPGADERPGRKGRPSHPSPPDSKVPPPDPGGKGQT